MKHDHSKTLCKGLAQCIIGDKKRVYTLNKREYNDVWFVVVVHSIVLYLLYLVGAARLVVFI